MRSESRASSGVLQAVQIVLLSIFSLQLSAASNTPFRIEINYGPIPFDVYTKPNINASGHPYIANCPVPTPSNPTTVRSCIQTLSASYVEGGATGVRFMFALRGGYGGTEGDFGASTPWDSEGNMNQAWTDNLNLFLEDLKAAGFIYVTPTPALDCWWSGAPYATATVQKCGSPQTETLTFYRWMPLGFDAINGFPDCQDVRDGYHLAAHPPVVDNQGFWGWQPYHNLMETMISSTVAAGLLFAEIDISQELNLADFTAMGRLDLRQYDQF